jgi:hypothetical protein
MDAIDTAIKAGGGTPAHVSVDKTADPTEAALQQLPQNTSAAVDTLMDNTAVDASALGLMQTLHASGMPVLLTQTGTASAAVAQAAHDAGLSCVTTPTTVMGQYSILALLSGAQSGVYGSDRAEDNRFPALPA